MARCCAVISGEGIFGNLILHQVSFMHGAFPSFIRLIWSLVQAQEEAPTSIDGTIRGLAPVRSLME